MQRSRPLFAMLLCLLIFLAWSSYVQRRNEELRKKRQQEIAGQEGQKAGAAEGVAGPQGGAGAPQVAVRNRPERTEKRGSLANDLVAIELGNRLGGGLLEVSLLDYYESPSERDEHVGEHLVLLPEIAGEHPTLALAFKEIDGRDLEDEEVTPATLRESLTLENENWEMDLDAEAVMATFRNQVNAGGVEGETLVLTSTLRLPPGSRHLLVTVTLENRGSQRHSVRYRLHGPGGIPTEDLRRAGSDIQVVTGHFIDPARGPHEMRLASPAAFEEELSRLERHREGQGPFTAIGLQNLYFAAVLLAVKMPGEPEEMAPPSPVEGEGEDFLGILEPRPFPHPEAVDGLLRKKHDLTLEALRARREAAGPQERARLEQRLAEAEEDAYQTARTSLVSRVLELPSGEIVTHQYALYLGPRKEAMLERYQSHNLAALNNYGWWTWIVKLFMGILKVFHAVARSWGIAIVCLTILVRFSLHPINRRQQAGMMRYQKKVQKIQPQIQEIKDTYKDDRMKMNRELQKLFKENDINPAQMMGGCMMVLLQFPIWIGLIQTLRYSIDLRQAPFSEIPILWWIRDLSQPDRFFSFDHTLRYLPDDLNLLPILYVILMLVQQRLQPKPTDPQARQAQKTMTIMMVAFGFIFYGFASGLLVYFLTSAIFGIVESRLIKRKLAREEEESKPALATAPSGAPSSSGPLYQASRGVARPKKPPKPKGPRVY